MKRLKNFSLVLVGVAALTLAGNTATGQLTDPAARPQAGVVVVTSSGIPISVSCSFLGRGRRGFCGASAQGSNLAYTFYASGAVSVASGPPFSSARSAVCSGLGSVRVVVTDSAGNTGSATTVTSC